MITESFIKEATELFRQKRRCEEWLGYGPPEHWRCEAALMLHSDRHLFAEVSPPDLFALVEKQLAAIKTKLGEMGISA